MFICSSSEYNNSIKHIKLNSPICPPASVPSKIKPQAPISNKCRNCVSLGVCNNKRSLYSLNILMCIDLAPATIIAVGLFFIIKSAYS